MAMPSELNYANEADFTNRLMIPLLERLGFTLIAFYGGPREFGKDVVFGEIDRFGHFRYHGLQAKYVANISLSDARPLIEDCRQAFENPFRHPTTGQHERITCFYIVNGGTFSEPARESIFNAVEAPFGGHITLLDGQAVLSLQRWATFNRQELVGEKLTGIILELRYNRHLFSIIRRRFQAFIADPASNFPAGFRLRLNACSAYLQTPILPTLNTNEHIEAYWHDASVVNAALVSLALRVRSSKGLQKHMKQVLGWEASLEKSAGPLEEELTSFLKHLGIAAAIRSAIESLPLAKDSA
jgi:hypothetical protein